MAMRSTAAALFGSSGQTYENATSAGDGVQRSIAERGTAGHRRR